MKKTYITVLVLIVLIVGAVLIFAAGKKAEAPVSETPSGQAPVACTMEAKLCPDGSYVGRSGPKCEFAACPEVKSKAPAPAPVSGTTVTTTTTVVTTSPAVKEFTVTGQNFSFTPSMITVKKGDKVKITFKNLNGFHNLIIDEFNVGTKTIQGGTQESIEFTADKTGSFQYYCSVGSHRAMGMWGTLKVE